LIVRITYPIFFSTDYFSDLEIYPLTELSGIPVWAISLIGAILGGIAGGGSLWLFGKIWKILRKVDAMGLGDVKMMFAVGALLGWQLGLFSIFLAAFTGAVAGIFVIFKQKEKDFQAQIPFGIFLGIGSIIAILFGNQLLAWYMAKFIY
jgi:leader peptidase (prepilin peptidase) / N-methyltransferase